jgi:GT2 family glycosyltransferase
MHADSIVAEFRYAQEQITAVGVEEGKLRPGVAVAVCTYRRPKGLNRFLDSLGAQERRPEQLVIVDASPDDETEQSLRKRPDLDALAAAIQYFRVAGPLVGLTRQRNFAARWVETDLIAYFDDDIVLEPGCLAELERAHRLHGDRLVGAGAYIENGGQRSRLIWRLRTALKIVPHLRPGSYCRSGMSITWSFLPPNEELTEGQWLPGVAMWKTAVVRELGFFEGFCGYCQGEDLEFSLRAARKGTLVMAGAARVLHLHEASGRPDHFKRGYMAIYNRYQIHRRGLEDRTWRDQAWFCYAWTVDSLLLLRHMVVPRRIGPTLRQLAGRAKAACDLICKSDPKPMG